MLCVLVTLLQSQAVLIVNVASRCGYTSSNYADFPKLKEQFGDKLEIVLVPCPQFGDQEFKKEEEVCEFAKARSFKGTITSILHVNGPSEDPLFTWLKEQSGDTSPIGWNFAKFVVAPNGTTVKRHSFKTGAASPAVIADIQAVLSA